MSAPTSFGRYTLISKLGRGGMAEVFLAFISGLGEFRKLCVIKRLHDDLEEEPGFVEMFLDEARLAAQLNHPNIVQTYEVGDIDGSHFIAMEYLEGRSILALRQRCQATSTTLDPALVAHIVMKALEGLQYAHELTGFDGEPLEIIHRDISPQNLFVTYEGAVKLLDFGIAKAATNVVQTSFGSIKGKFSYISPEQGRGDPIDRRSDLWSVGVLLWELLSGRRLFKGINDVAVLRETLGAKIPPLREVDSTIPVALEAIAIKALQRDPGLRYDTAQAMRADLRSYLLEEKRETGQGIVTIFMKELFSDEIRASEEQLSVLMGAATPTEMAPIQEASSFEGREVEEVERGQQPAEPALEIEPSSLRPAPAPPRRRWALLVVAMLFGGALVFLVGAWLSRSSSESGGGPQVGEAQPATLQPAPEQTALAHCAVSFSSSPASATVIVDGESIGTTPFIRHLEQQPDDEQVAFTFRLEGYADVVVRTPIDGASMRLHTDLAPERSSDAGDSAAVDAANEAEPAKAPSGTSRRQNGRRHRTQDEVQSSSDVQPVRGGGSEVRRDASPTLPAKNSNTDGGGRQVDVPVILDDSPSGVPIL